MTAPVPRLTVVSFDLDGTLIHPAIFNAVADRLGFGAPLQDTYQAYAEGILSLEDAFHADVKHFIGRPVAEMMRALDETDAWTPGIVDAVELLKEAGLSVILTTDQPDFLARHVLDWGFDALVCSPGTVTDGIVQGVAPRFEKWPNLSAHLNAEGIDPAQVAHVGNGENDIPVFRKVGWGVAVNPSSPKVSAAADHAIPRLTDLVEVARHLMDMDTSTDA